mgnify:CR=1 FL=1
MEYKYLREKIYRSNSDLLGDFLFEVFEPEFYENCLKANIYKITDNNTTHVFLGEASIYYLDTLMYGQKYSSYKDCIITLYNNEGKFCYSVSLVDNKDVEFLTKIHEFLSPDSCTYSEDLNVLKRLKQFILELRYG